MPKPDGRPDAENPEWAAADFAAAKPAHDVFSPAQLASLKRRPGQRGPGKRAAKVRTALRLDPETLARFRATGPGWQSRMAEALKRAADELG